MSMATRLQSYKTHKIADVLSSRARYLIYQTSRPILSLYA
jgi:hypothetical protein